MFDSNAYRLFRDAMVLLGSGLLTWFGWRRVKAADQQNRNQTRALDRQTDQIRLTRKQMELTRRDQLSKRFTEAVKQLGDDKLEIRMGGIAGLWAVATESTHPEDRIMVLDVLCAFVRNAKPPGEDEPQTVRPDVKFAMDRLGSEGPYFPWGDVEEGHRPYQRDFSGAYLSGWQAEYEDWRHSCFNKSTMRDVIFNNNDFGFSCFQFSLIEGSMFNFCNFNKSQFTSAYINNSGFNNCRMIDFNATSIIFNKVNIFSSHICSFYGLSSVLNDIYISRSILVDFDAEESTINNIVINSSYILNAHMSLAKISNCKFSRCDLNGLIFKSGSMVGGNIVDCDVSNSSYYNAIMSDVAWEHCVYRRNLPPKGLPEDDLAKLGVIEEDAVYLTVPRDPKELNLP